MMFAIYIISVLLVLFSVDKGAVFTIVWWFIVGGPTVFCLFCLFTIGTIQNVLPWAIVLLFAQFLAIGAFLVSAGRNHCQKRRAFAYVFVFWVCLLFSLTSFFWAFA